MKKDIRIKGELLQVINSVMDGYISGKCSYKMCMIWLAVHFILLKKNICLATFSVKQLFEI